MAPVQTSAFSGATGTLFYRLWLPTVQTFFSSEIPYSAETDHQSHTIYEPKRNKSCSKDFKFLLKKKKLHVFGHKNVTAKVSERVSPTSLSSPPRLRLPTASYSDEELAHRTIRARLSLSFLQGRCNASQVQLESSWWQVFQKPPPNCHQIDSSSVSQFPSL